MWFKQKSGTQDNNCLSVSMMFLPHFDVFCDIGNRRHRFFLFYIIIYVYKNKYFLLKNAYLCRKFLQDVMEETLGEVVGSRSFDSLVKAVNTEKEKKAGLQQTILKYVLSMFG